MYRVANCTLLLFMIISASGKNICVIVNCVYGNCILDGREVGGFRCDCHAGYTGQFCERPCTSRDSDCILATQPPICNSTNCHNGQCSESDMGGCTCYNGWTGEACEIDINFCEIDGRGSSHFGPCDDIGSTDCIDGNETYSCECVIGYTGQNCEFNIDECSSFPSPCSGNGACIDGYFGTYSCICNERFTGQICDTKIAVCDSNPCLNNGTCHTVNGDQFRCECPSGYGGFWCEVEDTASICAITSPCINGGICRDDGNGNFTCLCRNGYSGIICSTVNCTNEFCGSGGVCVQNDLKPHCECNPRYRGDHCELDLCGNITCLNGGLCIVNDAGAQPICHCVEGFAGRHCELESICSNLTCLNGGACEMVNDSTSHCTCSNGFSGQTCELQNTCFNLTCLNDGTCSVANDSVPQCLCRDGFSGQQCEFNLNAIVCSDTTCQNGGTCIAVNESFLECACTERFVGERCEICDISFFDLICLNGGTCMVLNNSTPFCSCIEGFMGERCQDKLCRPNSCSNKCKCIEREDQTGIVHSCHCPEVTIASTCGPDVVDRTNVAVLGIVLALGIVLMCLCFFSVVICCYACRKYHLKRIYYTDSNQFVIHAEYHPSTTRYYEDDISFDLVVRHKITGDVLNRKTEKDVICSNASQSLEMQSINLRFDEIDQEFFPHALHNPGFENQGRNALAKRSIVELEVKSETNDNDDICSSASQSFDIQSINLTFDEFDQETFPHAIHNPEFENQYFVYENVQAKRSNAEVQVKSENCKYDICSNASQSLDIQSINLSFGEFDEEIFPHAMQNPGFEHQGLTYDNLQAEQSAVNHYDTLTKENDSDISIDSPYCAYSDTQTETIDLNYGESDSGDYPVCEPAELGQDQVHATSSDFSV